MLAIRPPSKQSPSKSTKKYSPNLMPCRINHTAPIKVDKRYWDPKVIRNRRGKEELVAYFRGRRLIGRKVKVPEGWRGVVLRVGEEIMPRASRAEERRGEDAGMDVDGDEDEMEEEEMETKIVDEEATFDDLTVWGMNAWLMRMRIWLFEESKSGWIGRVRFMAARMRLTRRTKSRTDDPCHRSRIMGNWLGLWRWSGCIGGQYWIYHRKRYTILLVR
ncbi:hypothetical protein EYC84_000677 [Monilinia fructicola]|uniref:Uncharacterized protein n=1 Tax=Monilinia fructicola TaxID=38448 RepID=A0A5M9JTH0_MONFR|nr:hypothetical protein EYC84_000677 [Monilinia fructicola]